MKRKLTKRGKIVKIVNSALGLISIIMFLMLTTWCESGGSLIVYIPAAALALFTVAICVIAEDKIFNE